MTIVLKLRKFLLGLCPDSQYEVDESNVRRNCIV